MEKEKFYSPKEVGAMFGLSESSIYRYLALGYLKGMKTPGEKGTWLITEEGLDEFKALMAKNGDCLK